MKFLIVLTMTFGSLSLFANSDSPLLTVEQLKALPREQQAKYIKSVQKIMAEMAKKTLYMAEQSESQGNSRMPASLIKPSDATPLQQQLEIDALAASDTALRVKARAEAVDAADKAKAKAEAVSASPAPVPAATATPGFSDVRSEASAGKERVAAPSPSASAATARPADTSAAKKERPVITETRADVAGDRERPAPSATPAPPAAAPAPSATPVVAADTSKKGTADPSPKKGPASTEADKKGAKTEEAKTSGNNYRCMYSGWVVAKDPCEAQPKFPDYFSIEGIDKSKMVCPKGQTMCNPVVFGLHFPADSKCKKLQDGDCRKKAEPICVNKGAWPTEDCYHKSTFADALVAAEINTEIAPDQFQHFGEAFNDLCNPDKIKSNPFSETLNGQPRTPEKKEAIQRDIRITCGWARKQLNLVKEALDIDTKGDEKNKDGSIKKWESKKAPKKQKSDESGAQK